ncbi:MAG: ParB/RepB/Spo0J family partition protein [Candidatus Pacebacteria bacterium]|nr:ParB/RepB/Spo0J family partition protein [Candidatus Paceibacterota bacterium]
MAFQGDSIYWVEVEKIVPNPFQPRREFDEQKLKELSESVRMYGILQPLTVTRNEIQREDGTFYTEYELVAGERRLRASKLAGLSQVPVIIREGENNEQEKLELAIIENLQREDLNAVDRALAFRQLAEVFGLSHTQVAQKVGRSREYVSNTIRLLGLPDYMLNALRRGEMTEGHARTLLMLNDRPEEQDVVFREILLKKLSVREVERIVRKIATDKVRKKNDGEFDTELIEMEKRFMETLGTRVQIQKTDFGGKLTIDYFSVEDLEGMLVRMKTDQFNAIQKDHSELLTANTPITIIKEDEEVSSKVDEAIEYPAPEVLMENSFIQPEVKVENHTYNHEPQFSPQTQLESPINPNQIANHEPDGYLVQNVDSIPVYPSQNNFTPAFSTPTPTPTPSVSVPPITPSQVNNSVPVNPYNFTPVSRVESVVAPTPVVPTQSVHQSSFVPPASAPVTPINSHTNMPPVASTAKSEDESDLYSIRNFTV